MVEIPNPAKKINPMQPQNDMCKSVDTKAIINANMMMLIARIKRIDLMDGFPSDLIVIIVY